METLSGIIYGDLFYIIFGAPIWFLIDLLALREFAKNANIIRFILGLIVLNVFVTIAGKFIPLLTLLTMDTAVPHFKTSVFVLMVYLVSFSMAILPSMINKTNGSSKQT